MIINKVILKKSISCAFAGFVNGIMGTGGGTVIYLTNDEGVERQKELRGFMIAMVGVFSASGTVGSIREIGDWGGYLFMLLGSVAGCLAGGRLTCDISGKWLRVIFSALLVISGIKMLTTV